ncbi:MAG: tRNA uridine-5-carboxymethylaminomethyl(34) synthesis GTPase MnmE [Flavobacteriaceae bacterium]|nr:tRNA uridine-5-carboxymethylaminomethyl(34) synthesis GTPase MnmE [Flavobacteriaceae bacterium]
MIQQDTIIAVSTPAGVGAIANIRLSGDKAIALVNENFQSVRKGKSLLHQKSHTIHLGHIVANGNVIDEVLVSLFKGPNSYTGEDVVEISCHGSHYIQEKILQHFLQQDCRLADHGEFTLRAFLNGKMDLSQAEAVADLIASNSEASHQIAMQQMRGGISNELKDLRLQLLDFAALIELELDFSGEDVEFADRTKFYDLIERISAVLKRLIDSFAFGNAMKNGIPVAIIGEPNVGKSTLLNALLNEEKAIVSDIAGTTRDAIEDEIVLNGVVFRFIDTDGLRTTSDVIENIGIQKAYEKAQKAQLVIFLIESKRIIDSPEDYKAQLQNIEEKLPEKNILIIANKVDQLSEIDQKFLKGNHEEVLLLSAKEKLGIDTLEKELISLINAGELSNNETVVTNSRHFESLSNAFTSIQDVKNGLDLGIASDLVAIDIRECLRHLGNITGEYDVDKDILGHIFSNFCIGK